MLVATALALNTFSFPEGWFPLAIGWILALIVLGNIYIRSLGRQPYADSMLYLVIERLWATGKMVLVANAAWGAYECFLGGVPLGG